MVLVTLCGPLPVKGHILPSSHDYCEQNQPLRECLQTATDLRFQYALAADHVSHSQQLFLQSGHNTRLGYRKDWQNGSQMHAG
jgi:hypothetical protein